ncbi:unnamed protein product [Parajaminaea phylloscopi]
MLVSHFLALLSAVLVASSQFVQASNSERELPAGFHRLAKRVAARRELTAHLKHNRLIKRFQSGKLLPLPNGFPDPSADAAAEIQVAAHGTLPNGPLPNKLSEEEKTSLQLVALNELFEVAFFTSLLYNVTNTVDGFTDFQGETQDYVVKTLQSILAQEEIHALGANAILKNSGIDPIKPCNNYFFPTTDFEGAIALADLFTGVVLGALQDITEVFAHDGPPAATRLLASVIGQEGEQRGYFRRVQKHVPSETPFLTTGIRSFAFTVIQNFFSDCPSLDEIHLRKYATVRVAQPPSNEYTPGKNTSVVLIFPPKAADAGLNLSYYVTYINQLNLPTTFELKPHPTLPHTPDNWLTYEAVFPYSDALMNGLTLAAVGCIPGPFKDIQEVANSVYWAPALIYMSPPDY